RSATPPGTRRPARSASTTAWAPAATEIRSARRKPRCFCSQQGLKDGRFLGTRAKSDGASRAVFAAHDAALELTSSGRGPTTSVFLPSVRSSCERTFGAPPVLL